MSGTNPDTLFAGSIPALYEQYLVPMIFEPYAVDLASRLRNRKLASVLEIAAGTGVVTRAVAAALPDSVEIVATDLNQAMLDQAATLPIKRPVAWRQADAMQLPFADGAFTAVVCQFGAMFFPDKAKAFAEAYRVLKPGGIFVFNVWDRIETNEFADVVTTALETVFPDNPIHFLKRLPHDYFDYAAIRSALQKAGFDKEATIDVVTACSRAPSARAVATAYCQGTPVRNEIETRDASKLIEATDVAMLALEKRYGKGAVEAKIQAHVVTVEK